MLISLFRMSVDVYLALFAALLKCLEILSSLSSASTRYSRTARTPYTRHAVCGMRCTGCGKNRTYHNHVSIIPYNPFSSSRRMRHVVRQSESQHMIHAACKHEFGWGWGNLPNDVIGPGFSKNFAATATHNATEQSIWGIDWKIDRDAWFANILLSLMPSVRSTRSTEDGKHNGEALPPLLAMTRGVVIRERPFHYLGGGGWKIFFQQIIFFSWC